MKFLQFVSFSLDDFVASYWQQTPAALRQGFQNLIRTNALAGQTARCQSTSIEVMALDVPVT